MAGRTFAKFYEIESSVAPTTLNPGEAAEHVISVTTWTAPGRGRSARRLIRAWLEWSDGALECDHSEQTDIGWIYRHETDNEWHEVNSWGPNSGGHQTFFRATVRNRRDTGGRRSVRIRSYAEHDTSSYGEDFDDVELR